MLPVTRAMRSPGCMPDHLKFSASQITRNALFAGPLSKPGILGEVSVVLREGAMESDWHLDLKPAQVWGKAHYGGDCSSVAGQLTDVRRRATGQFGTPPGFGDWISQFLLRSTLRFAIKTLLCPPLAESTDWVCHF